MAHGKLEQPARGYLANILTIPPLIYAFQYNPTQITDSKKLEWKAKYTDQNPAPARGLPGLSGLTLGTATEKIGRVFSAAEIKRFDKEGPRTVSFKFTIDGRELSPGEPERLRNDEGDIVADLAVIRSFAYPQLANWMDVFGSTSWSTLWFNEPPTMTLVLGGSSMEGYLEELKITETLFNSKLNPTRADVEITLIEKINSISFILDSVKRLGREIFYSDYEDIGKVIF